MVYFVQAIKHPKSPVKIGYSRDGRRGATKRLVVLQAGNPDRLAIVATAEGGAALETEYHKRFKKTHRSGEWFSWTEALGSLLDRQRLRKPITSPKITPPALMLPRHGPTGFPINQKVIHRHNPRDQLFED